MNILHEDSDIIVCIKPKGIISQVNSSGGESMISILENHCKCTIYPIHRLDKDVGGVMVYAKNKNSAANLNAQITNHIFKKEYIAIVHNTPTDAKGIMIDLLFKDSRKNKSFVVLRQRKGVKSAKLEYEVIKTIENLKGVFTVVLVRLYTGRTHQIRVQFASRKMPLAGDKKYGAKDCFKSIKLWSNTIGFIHPKTKKDCIFTYNPSDEFFEL